MTANNFITNSPKNGSMADRLAELIGCSEELKFLVGFFYFSGVQELYKPLLENDQLQIKLLVGLEVESGYGRLIESPHEYRRDTDRQNSFLASLRKAVQSSEMDNREFKEQVNYFLELMISGRLVIRKTEKPNHAKLYIFRMNDAHKTLLPAAFITGSSNLTRAGLVGQQEFNVEIKDFGTKDAGDYFDELWADAALITESDDVKRQIIGIIQHESLAAAVTPFEAYVKVLMAYRAYHENDELDLDDAKVLKDNGFDDYAYQRDAVTNAKKIVESDGGVLLADVVGLGKTIVACRLARALKLRGIVIAPPGLIGSLAEGTGWVSYLDKFKLDTWRTYSVGKLDDAKEYVESHPDVQVVVVDEAHRFRSQDSQGYEKLQAICRGRKVILLTATPFNNAPSDIYSLLKLFVNPGRSTIGFTDNLERTFATKGEEYRRLTFINKNHDSRNEKERAVADKYYRALTGKTGPIELKAVRQQGVNLAKFLRDTVSQVIVRRNRLDLKEDPIYSKEVGILPEIEPPAPCYYELTPEQSAFYDRVLAEYFCEGGRFTGAVYRPVNYRDETDETDDSDDIEKLSQRNLFSFMRRLLVKRFESSFTSFLSTVGRFEGNMEAKLKIAETTGTFVLDERAVDMMRDGDEEAVDERLAELGESDEGRGKLYKLAAMGRRDDFIRDIRNDLALMKEIQMEVKKLKLVDEDTKAASLARSIEDDCFSKPAKDGSRRKIVVFSEYADTVEYLAKALDRYFPGRVLSAFGGVSAARFKEVISNFDVTAKTPSDDCDILVATDKMSEGFNLARAGAIVNYDIPWNPVRVIQRVGRINRIGQRPFETLQIFNFFPSEKVADIVRCREIAERKMFMIHSIIGEDSKIFSVDEEPTAARLFQRLGDSPDQVDKPSLITVIRKELAALEKTHPEIIERVTKLPNRIKTAKAFSTPGLHVFFGKGAAIYPVTVSLDGRPQQDASVEDGLDAVRCPVEEPPLEISASFWEHYRAADELRHEMGDFSHGGNINKAVSVVRACLDLPDARLDKYRTLLNAVDTDLMEYRTISDRTLTRIADISPALVAKDIDAVVKELSDLGVALGSAFMKPTPIDGTAADAEIIVAIENVTP